MTQSPAGWYPDPYGTPQLRWWDGSQWTDATHPLEVVAAQNAQVGAQAGAGARGGAASGPLGGGSTSGSTGAAGGGPFSGSTGAVRDDSLGGSTGPHSGPHGAPQAGTAVEGPPRGPEPATGSSSAPTTAGTQDTTDPGTSGTPDAAAFGTTGAAASDTSDASASSAPGTGTSTAVPGTTGAAAFDTSDASASSAPGTGIAATGTAGATASGTAGTTGAAAFDTSGAPIPGTPGTDTVAAGAAAPDTSGAAASGAPGAGAAPASSAPSFAPAGTAAGGASPTAATAQWTSPGGAVVGSPSGGGPAWAGPGMLAQRGDTAQLPVPDFPPPRQSRPMVPWIAGGVAAAVVIVLLVVGTIYLTANRGGQNGEGGLASSPTSNAESSPPSSDPSPSAGTEGPPSAGRVTDRVSGLSYFYPGAPWQLIEPSQIDSSDPGGQRWSSGFQALSQDDYEQGKDWFGSVLAGPLAAGAPYNGPQSMRDIAAAFLLSNEGALYEPPHERRIVEDKAITVSGRPGWLLRFEMDFSEQSKANGWKWQKELGAVVLVDRGEAGPPALLFATVPDNLDTRVIDEVISSLRVE